jgi:cell division protein FtsI/penicillin-binding protein 2
VRRAAPVVVLAACAFGLGLVCGSSSKDPAQTLAQKYAREWTRGDFAGMYAALDPDVQKHLSVEAFTAEFRDALNTATGVRLIAGNPKKHGSDWAVPVFVQTRSFGPVRASVLLPIKGGDHPHVEWAPNLAFPGVKHGQKLTRETTLPARADLLARDGSALTKGPDRGAGLGPVSDEIVGHLGPIPADQKAQYEQMGYPADAQVGLNGLERALETQLTGIPGGKLLAGGHVIASAAPQPAKDVRTSIDRSIEESAISALGNRDGGVVALKPSTGEILALAGSAYSVLQPPGSTFKIVTATGALAAGATKLTDVYPVETAATLAGVQLSNANGEECGGTLIQSFANSCNSVFAPLGAKIGPEKLYAQAVAYGFNKDPGIPGAATSVIPPPAELGDDLQVGSSAIGQGDVQATPLQMGWVASAVANRGNLPKLSLLYDASGKPAPTTPSSSKKVALEIQKMMVATVEYGTGTSAQIPGVKVAGKTGTAELRDEVSCDDPGADQSTCGPNPANTDAWFTSYAPVSKPKVAVAVMLISAGAGGDTAAPVAQQVLSTALGKTG